MLYHSFIDTDTWDQAGWSATAYLVTLDNSAPPVLGLVFKHEIPAKKIFADLISKIGKEDTQEQLRVAIIEGPIDGKDGYSVHVSSNPEKSPEVIKAKEGNAEIPKILVVSRVNRMTPAPDSPHLSNFKKSFGKQRKYLLIPVVLKDDSSDIVPHFDLAIGKTEIHFRLVQDVAPNDRDAVIFRK